MVKLIFYGWDYGMETLLFVKLLKEKTHLTLKEAMEVRTMITDDMSHEILIEDEDEFLTTVKNGMLKYLSNEELNRMKCYTIAVTGGVIKIISYKDVSVKIVTPVCFFS